MTCRDFADFLMDYLAGSLPVGQQAVFEEHLGECPDCVAYLATYRRTLELSKAAFRSNDSVPAEVPEDLVHAILKARSHQPRPKG